MTRLFTASRSKLSRRYNLLMLRINIIPACVLPTLFLAVYFTDNDTMPIKYYVFVFGALSACLLFSFVTVLVGSIIATIRLRGNTEHTFVDIKDRFLIVSRYIESTYLTEPVSDYKELSIIRLDEIEEIYLYKKSIIIIAPTKRYEGRADWLSYSDVGMNFTLDRNWYGEFGGEETGGVEIHNMFRYPERIARTIEHSRNTKKAEIERRQAWREHLISITRSAQYRKARNSINRRRQR